MSKICFLDDKGNLSEIYEFNAYKEGAIPISIYSDDTIKSIKYKILKGIKEPYAYEELYLFTIIEKPFELINWLKQITKNDTILLTKERLIQVLVNMSNPNDQSYNEELYKLIEQIHKLPKITSDIIQQLDWFKERQTMYYKIPLGIRIKVSFTNKYNRILPFDETFITNPYDVLPLTNIVDWNTDKTIVMLDDEFLFHYGNSFDNNTIYVCLAKNLVSDQKYLPVYFPYLTLDNINSGVEFDTKILDSQTKTKNIIESSQFDKFIHETDLYHRVAMEDLDIQYNEKGIENFSFYIENNQYNQLKLTVPLEPIFKSIHASSDIPMIVFHPGQGQDDIIRMYYLETSENGKEIPVIPSTIINEILKETHGVRQHIVMYLPLNQIDTSITTKDFVTVILHLNGNIEYKGSLKVPIPYNTFEVWLKNMSDLLFQKINEYLVQSGYIIQPFTSIFDPYIRISSIQYVWIFNAVKKINFEKNIQALSPLFYGDKEKIKDGYSFLYKKVEHFQHMNEIEQIISEFVKLKNPELIFKELKRHFSNQYSDGMIRKMLEDYTRKYRTIKGRYMNRKVETLTHSGFITTFTPSSLGGVYTIRVNNVDMIQYLICMDKYINSILILSQYPEKIKNKTLLNEWKEKYNKEEFVLDGPTVTDSDSDILMENIITEKNKDLIDKDITDEKEEIDKSDESDEDPDYDGYFNIQQEDSSSDEDEEEEIKIGSKDDKDEYESSSSDEHEPAMKKDNSDDLSLPSLGGANIKDVPKNYFLKRIKEKDPILFQSMDGYTKVCQEDQKRQPVLITQNEKNEIDGKYDKKPYENALEFGKDSKGESLYYICPRYWCTKQGKEGPINAEQANDENYCGKIITKLAKPGKDEYVYDRFYEKSELRLAPGFSKPKNSDVCYPCCFGDWNAELQKARRSECNPDVYGEKEEDKNREDKNKAENNLYIKDPQQVLEKGRNGVIPFEVQRFLNIDSTSCIKIDQIKTVKPNCPVFLRHGVENTPNNNQSFVACMADIYSAEKGLPKEGIPKPTVEDFRNILSNAITLDMFVSSCNGTLVSQFQSRKSAITVDNIDISEYKDQKIYQNIDINDESQLSFLKYTIIGYEIFLNYLTDPNVKIDHVFIWDFICEPNEKLFTNGINLVILEMLKDDITSKVNIVCPTMNYKQPLYNLDKPSVLLYKTENIYEPIYRYTRIKEGNVMTITYDKQFSLKKPIGNINEIMKMIQSAIDKSCSPMYSKKKSYTFKPNKDVDEILDVLKTMNLSIESKIVNYQGKVIGLMVNYKSSVLYVPCKPSVTTKSVPIVWMDNITGLTYQKTTELLLSLHKETNGRILCKPAYRIVEDEMVIGILTITNQFIPISEPIPDTKTDDNIPTLKSSNYLIADQKISNAYSETSSVESETIKKLYLENQFYNSFRTTLRILMRLYKNRKITKQMLSICNRENLSNREKREKIINRLEKLSEDHIKFHKYDPEVLNGIYEVFTCQHNVSKKDYCLSEVNTSTNILTNVLLIPDFNLITKADNRFYYYLKMADELVRYKRIQLFMFYPDQYLNMDTRESRIIANEFMIPRSLITNYFKDIKLSKYGLYGQNTTYDMAESDEQILPEVLNWNDEYKTS